MPPDWLLWLLPVPVATVGAILWGAWSNRARGPEQASATVEAHERFRAAMAAPVPPPSRPARRGRSAPPRERSAG